MVCSVKAQRCTWTKIYAITWTFTLLPGSSRFSFFMKFGIRGKVADIITYTKFSASWFRRHGILTPHRVQFPVGCVAIRKCCTTVNAMQTDIHGGWGNPAAGDRSSSPVDRPPLPQLWHRLRGDRRLLQGLRLLPPMVRSLSWFVRPSAQQDEASNQHAQGAHVQAYCRRTFCRNSWVYQ